MTKQTHLDLPTAALMFATVAHNGQHRKYTGEPYVNHCIEVAALTAFAGGDDHMIAAAYLHDTVEDTDTTLEDIRSAFGSKVMDLVSWLTDEYTSAKYPALKRALRKEYEVRRLALASEDVKTIKLADLISNTRTIKKFDPGFAKVYLAEKRRLLPYLSSGNGALFSRAVELAE